MPKFLLDPCRHRRFHSTTRQKPEVFEIYDLRENRQPLVEVFGKLLRSSIRWDKPKSSGFNSLTALPHVQESDVIKRQNERSSSNPERHLRSEFPVMAFEDVHKPFQRHLKVSRLESDHDGRIVHALTEVHP